MVPSALGLRALGVIGSVALAGCRPTVAAPSLPTPPAQRVLYPEHPSVDDPLSTDPCAVKVQPDLFFKDVPNHDLLIPLHENLAFLEAANPVFVCGLERIEILGDDAYRLSAPPAYTRRSVGLYTPLDRIIHIKAGAGLTLTHEVGHHIHNLGYFAPTIRAFLAQSWEIDPNSGERKPCCTGPDCFLNDAAASEPREDWARTFERVLLKPVETGVATNFSFNGPTPMQEKIRLIRSIAKLVAPVQGIVNFGKSRVLDVAEAMAFKDLDLSPVFPATLPGETVRRIFARGKSSIQSSVWEKRRRPFLVGDYVVFPVFQEERRTLGFFAYDLKSDRFQPLELTLESIPEEFQQGASAFQELRVIENSDSLTLVGFLEDGLGVAVPIAFQL